MQAYLNHLSIYLPQEIRTNADISREHPEWSVEKISAKVGIETRHLAASEETACDMACKAGKQLFDDYKIDKGTIDYVILCTQSPDYRLPSSACILQDQLGLPKSCGAFDYNLGCSGYIYGLGLAKGLIISEQANRVLLLTTETYSKYLSPKDKGNKTIFGDAATASLISSELTNRGVNYSIEKLSYGTDGSGAASLIIRNGGSRHPQCVAEDVYDEEGNFIYNPNYLYMDGKSIFNFTAFEVPQLVRENLKKNKLQITDIDLVIFHQANEYMLNTVRKRCRIEAEKFFVDIQDVGNTVSNSIPIAIKKAEENGRLKNVKKMLLSGFGVGLSMGTVVLTKQ
jgi:beta-ketoacyl-acyl-carrier-protein synthase III